MNHPNLAPVAPEPAAPRPHPIVTGIQLGDIFTITSARECAPAKRASKDVFSEVRKIAHENKGTPVLFAGTFPDGKNRVQATLSVPNGQSVKDHREKLAEIFDASVQDVVSNYFTKIEQDENGAERSSGHYYLSLTADF